MPNSANLPLEIIHSMNAHHRQTLMQIFEHPLTHNLTFREVSGLINAIGTVELKHDGDVILHVGDEQISMQNPQDKDLSGDEIMTMRHFLQRAGLSPSILSSAEPGRASSGMIIAIDRAHADIYAVSSHGTAIGTERASEIEDARHISHHIDRKQHDRDREETYPSDVAFFDQIADLSIGKGRIVVIGHGKGQSNEAQHLSEYLRSNRTDVYTRIAGEIVADLSHLTASQLIALGRNALQQDADQRGGSVLPSLQD